MSQDGEPRDRTERSDGTPRPSVQATSADPAADPAGPPALAPDAVLAERFRIVRFVARGGMGELYEAEDLELGERVALKTILPSIAARRNTLDRFRREVHLARRVTHPNVCRTFDLFHHREGDGDIAFVTMEFLEGETLADLLRRKKHLTPEEALPIAQQVASALSAAHDAGVVHRDLKAGNVLLVPGESDGKMRAVVTDFGLAVPAREEAGSGSLTATGHFVGTPAYMAPEQVEGKPITQATDVYSFGILLYEMMTGALPFEGGSPLAVAARRHRPTQRV
jgi:serine/threonine protein kinase